MDRNWTTGDLVWHTKHPGIYPIEHWGTSKAGVPDLRFMDPSELGFEHPWTPLNCIHNCDQVSVFLERGPIAFIRFSEDQ